MTEELKNLSFLPYFKFSQLRVLFPAIKNASLRQKVSRWLKKGDILELKKGFYVTNKYYERYISDYNYRVYLANILCHPSYVSGAYILQKEGAIMEAIYPITSITTKSTRKYSNKLGEFLYFSISEQLYTGYKKDYYTNEPVYIATLAKALFDYLYIKYSKMSFTANNILARERFNIEVFARKDKNEFKHYCEISNNKLLLEVSKKVFLKNINMSYE